MDLFPPLDNHVCNDLLYSIITIILNIFFLAYQNLIYLTSTKDFNFIIFQHHALFQITSKHDFTNNLVSPETESTRTKTSRIRLPVTQKRTEENMNVVFSPNVQYC